jgi:hypothetical protein
MQGALLIKPGAFVLAESAFCDHGILGRVDNQCTCNYTSWCPELLSHQLTNQVAGSIANTQWQTVLLY